MNEFGVKLAICPVLIITIIYQKEDILSLIQLYRYEHCILERIAVSNTPNLPNTLQFIVSDAWFIEPAIVPLMQDLPLMSARDINHTLFLLKLTK